MKQVSKIKKKKKKKNVDKIWNIFINISDYHFIIQFIFPPSRILSNKSLDIILNLKNIN